MSHQLLVQAASNFMQPLLSNQPWSWSSTYVKGSHMRVKSGSWVKSGSYFTWTPHSYFTKNILCRVNLAPVLTRSALMVPRLIKPFSTTLPTRGSISHLRFQISRANLPELCRHIDLPLRFLLIMSFSTHTYRLWRTCSYPFGTILPIRYRQSTNSVPGKRLFGPGWLGPLPGYVR